MDAVPTWLTKAVDAAGVCMVYNADDWQAMTSAPLPDAANDPNLAVPPPLSH